MKNKRDEAATAWGRQGGCDAFGAAEQPGETGASGLGGLGQRGRVVEGGHDEQVGIFGLG